MKLRSEPNPGHKQIGFYPGSPSFDRFIEESKEAVSSLYQALLWAGITPTHRVLMPWGVGYVDVTDPDSWDSRGKVRCHWVSPYESIDPANSWKNSNAIIFEPIIDI